jgi:membrane protein implicated in regulation of membrane protease activity
MSGKGMQFVWMSISAIAALVAAAFLWRRQFDIAFVVAAIAGIAWFLNYRVQMRRITTSSDHEASLLEDENQD